eukprot:246119-Karenia_brevis.AAC.1
MTKVGPKLGSSWAMLTPNWGQVGASPSPSVYQELRFEQNLGGDPWMALSWIDLTTPLHPRPSPLQQTNIQFWSVEAMGMHLVDQHALDASTADK